jgi:hypothetical protein
MTTEFFPESASDWCGGPYGVGCYDIDLSPWAGLNNIKVMFEAYCRFGNNLFIDNISISGPVGMEEQKHGELGISVFPNPTTGVFNLTVTKATGDIGLGVYNLQGQLIYSSRVNAKPGANNYKVDLTGHPKGIYYLQLTTEKATGVEKIMIR